MSPSRAIEVEPLGHVLVSMGLLSESTLQSALAVQQRSQPWRRLGALLLRVGLLRREDLARALRFQRNARFLARRGRIRAVFPDTRNDSS